jgi:arsenical pump membrane protein
VTSASIATVAIASVSIAAIIFRPWRLPEYLFAAVGALLLIMTGLMAWDGALAAAAKGLDVYLFLTGMMLLSELARREGLFEVLAALAVDRAKNSAGRLFLIVYGVGTLVTIFLSNDATAVVLTPAVYAAARQARVNPLPYLFVCAFIANAASFVLPISNPANLVIYGASMPPLPVWLAHLALPALAAIIVTYFALRWALRRALAECPAAVTIPPLPGTGRLVAAGIVVTGLALLVASSLGVELGLPTFACGAAVTLAVVLAGNGLRQPHLALWPVLKHVTWGVIPLVAGLFVLVDAVGDTGAFVPVTAALRHGAAADPRLAGAIAGIAVGFGSNLINNLPMGLIAATIGQAAEAPARVIEGLLIGVDLGPNLSVTGSLATILWLVALRRENLHVGAWQFLRLGAIVMPPALIAALASLTLMPR